MFLSPYSITANIKHLPYEFSAHIYWMNTILSTRYEGKVTVLSS